MGRGRSRWVGLVLVALLVATAALQANGRVTPAVGESGRADLLRIDPPPGGGEMPAAYFLHDRHTEALQDGTCNACHPTDGARTVFRFKRQEAPAPEEMKDLYHEACIGCHREKTAAGMASGPLAADCRVCHRDTPPAVDGRVAFGLDKSLHYRHVKAAAIRPAVPGETDNCGACHHRFDEKNGRTVYVRGEEGDCRYCHQEQETRTASGPVRAMRQAAHDSCVACHQSLAAQGQKSGPRSCAGCHDAAAQTRIEKLTDIPRISRNRPDAVLLANRLALSRASGAEERMPAGAVVFDHRRHEAGVASCRTCHHASLDGCASCHTPNGDEKGRMVRLEQAMHRVGSDHSCIGCHDRRKRAPECAGCHGQMPVETAAARDCKQCHEPSLVEPAAIPADRDARRALARARVAGRAGEMAAVAGADIPQKVVIGVMADRYEAATMPHGKIVQAIYDNLAGNPLARQFHPQATTLCQGCHHNSPARLKPPPCASCHGEPSVAGQSGRPGLLGAYHGQCIGCHQRMGIVKPDANDCSACHRPRRSATLSSAKPE